MNTFFRVVNFEYTCFLAFTIKIVYYKTYFLVVRLYYTLFPTHCITPKLSGYATASKNEYLAESFVAYNKGELGKIDPEYSKAIRKLNGGNISNTSRNMKPVMVNYSTKNIPTLLLPKNEYAHVMSELNTNLTKEQLKQPVVLKAIGNYIYTVEINGFDDYRIIGKREIDI